MTIFNGGFRVAPRRNAVCTLAEGSVAAPTASQRRSRVAASQRRSANSVAASLQRRSVAAPTASQRHWPNGSVAASQRRSVAAPPAPRSVAASQRRSATRPRERHSATSETHASAPFAPALCISLPHNDCRVREITLNHKTTYQPRPTRCHAEVQCCNSFG